MLMQSTSTPIKQHSTSNHASKGQQHHLKKEVGTVRCGKSFKQTSPTSKQVSLGFQETERLYPCIRKDQSLTKFSTHWLIDFFEQRPIMSSVRNLTWFMSVIRMNFSLPLVCQTWRSHHTWCQPQRCSLHKIVKQAIANVLIQVEVLEILKAIRYIHIFCSTY